MPQLSTSDLIPRDPVTGVHTRSALPARLRAEIDEARLSAEGVSLLLMHVTFPRSASPVPDRIRNSALVNFVKQVEAAGYSSERLFRLGSNDFALLLPGTPGDQTAEAEQQIGEAAHATTLGDKLPFTLALDLGVATFPDDAQSGTALLESAKKRLREARKRGPGAATTRTPASSSKPTPLLTKLLTPLAPAHGEDDTAGNEALPSDSYDVAALHSLPALPDPTPEPDIRQRDIAGICALFDEARVVSIVGPDGAGKTHVAMLVAQERAAGYLGGSCFVALENARHLDQAVTAIGSALDFSFTGTDDQDRQLIGYLRDKEMLLVLDGLKSLPGAANLVRNLTASAPGVRALVTATEPLSLDPDIERVYRLGGLDDAGPEAKSSALRTVYLSDKEAEPDEVEPEKRAAQLFMQIASETSPGYAPDEADRAHIADICRMVGGLPLGIRLVAPWVRVLSCAEIAAGLAQFTEVASKSKDASTAQVALRAALDHSWGLLPQARREILAKLSVFIGSFSGRAAEKIAGATSSQLNSLGDKGLVTMTSNERYILHPVVRDYAGERLHQAPPMQADALDRYIRYYTSTLRTLEPTLKSGDEPSVCGTLDDIGAEIWNLRVAWDKAVRATHEDAIADALDSLNNFYEMRGLLTEGDRELGRAAESLRKGKDSRGETLGRVLTRQARFCTRLGRYEDAGNLLQEALVYLTGIYAPEETARALRGLGEVAYLLGKFDEAAQFMEEARIACGELEDGKRIWTTAPTLGLLDLTSVH